MRLRVLLYSLILSAAAVAAAAAQPCGVVVRGNASLVELRAWAVLGHGEPTLEVMNVSYSGGVYTVTLYAAGADYPSCSVGPWGGVVGSTPVRVEPLASGYTIAPEQVEPIVTVTVPGGVVGAAAYAFLAATLPMVNASVSGPFKPLSIVCRGAAGGWLLEAKLQGPPPRVPVARGVLRIVEARTVLLMNYTYVGPRWSGVEALVAAINESAASPPVPGWAAALPASPARAAGLVEAAGLCPVKARSSGGAAATTTSSSGVKPSGVAVKTAGASKLKPLPAKPTTRSTGSSGGVDTATIALLGGLAAAALISYYYARRG